MDVSPLAHRLFAALAAPEQHARLIRFTSPVPGLVVERFTGTESVCAPYRFEIDCLSTDAFLDLEAVLGQPLALHLTAADGAPRIWRGLCTEAMALGSDGGLARYRLVLEPWAALLRLRRNALIFQDLDVRGVIERVFADYPQAGARFELTRSLPVYPITTQYRETDFDFVTRLLAQAGLAWRFEAAAGGGDKDEGGQDDDPALDRWVIHDPDAEAPRVRPGSIRFHRIDATEADDAITAFAAQRQLVPNASVVGSWESALVLTRDGEASADASGLPLLEVFTQPRAGRFAAAGHADREARSRLDALRLPHALHRGAGSARQLAAGAAFTLTQHPGFAGEAFVPLTVEHRAVNNLGSGIAALLGQPADAAAELDRGSYRNRFLAVPAATPIVPLPRAKPHLHGPQTATVVGLPDSAVTANRDHQVRVQFAWQRGPSPNAGGLVDTASQHPGHAPGDDSSGTWVPVAEWLAGPNWGSHFLPRIGAEVLVECLHGDLDAPRITGQLYNGDVAPPFTAGIDSPSNHPGTLSGLHTRSLDGSHTQQWGLDDAPGQLRQWLHTSLGTSRMELGYLVGPGTTRSKLQGEGYAVTTRAWGNVHAGQGLLLSTTLRSNATSTQLDVREAVAQLKGAERTAQGLHDTLQQQSVPGLSANPALVALREAIDPEAEGKYSGSVNGQSAMQPEPGSRDPGSDAVGRFAEPVLIAESPDRIALTTPKSAIASAGGALHMTVQDDAHLTAGQTFAGVAGQHLAVYAHAGPLRAIAANGAVSLQAHTGALELLADQSVTVTATDDRIDVLASKKIVLQAGQTQVTLEGGDITFACPGTFTVKASQHPFLGGDSLAAPLPPLPEGLAEPSGNAPFSV